MRCMFVCKDLILIGSSHGRNLGLGERHPKLTANCAGGECDAVRFTGLGRTSLAYDLVNLKVAHWDAEFLICCQRLAPSAWISAQIPAKSQSMQNATLTDAVRRYQYLTGTVMPALARSDKTGWPVRNDHCFQRIVLDAICDGVWYQHIAKPAYKHLSDAQALQAVQLCEDIIAGRANLADLNQKSLTWRGKLLAGS